MSAEKSPFSDQTIRDALAPYVIELTPQNVEAVRKYAELLVRWNRTISLTSVHNPGDILRVHFGESFFGAQFVDFGLRRLADIGSGAGFPGLALKIVRPDLKLSLIESNLRKAAFLSEAVRVLNFKAIEVFCGRMEAYPTSDAQFDYVTARAVGNFSGILNWSRRKLAPTGLVILWVGPDGLGLLRGASDWRWDDPVLVPNSRQRFIVRGHPSAD